MGWVRTQRTASLNQQPYPGMSLSNPTVPAPSVLKSVRQQQQQQQQQHSKRQRVEEPPSTSYRHSSVHDSSSHHDRGDVSSSVSSSGSKKRPHKQVHYEEQYGDAEEEEGEGSYYGNQPSIDDSDVKIVVSRRTLDKLVELEYRVYDLERRLQRVEHLLFDESDE